ncbi:MAG: discoidin domain-containing protein, partial [Candidatus Izemoplasmatales bacterium]
MIKKLSLSITLFLAVLVTFSFIPLRAASPIGSTFDFTIETKIGDNEAVVTSLGNKGYGSKVTIDAGSYNAENEFVGYIVNGKVESMLPSNHSFTVSSDLNITALYKPTGTIAVAFMDSNQDLLDVSFISSGANATPPNISTLNKPGLEVSSSTPWSGSYSSVTEDSVLWVVYESTILETSILTVNNGTGSGTYDYNEIATVTASGTGNFQYWENEGVIVSLNPEYTFTVVDDTEITAVYDAVEVSPDPDSLFINLLPYSGLRPDYTTYIGQFVLPVGEEIVEFGLLISDLAGEITFDTPAVEKKRVQKYNPLTGEFVVSLLDSSYGGKNVRSYMITSDGMEETITYSDGYQPWNFVETFTNLPLTGSSYGLGFYDGDNSIQWNYSESRGDFSLDGKAIMLDKDGDGASLYATISGGISDFKIDYYDAYGGAAQVELYINDQLIETSPSVDFDLGNASIYSTFYVSNINVGGEFVLKILSADSQMVLDNLSWTSYYPVGGVPPIISGTEDETITEGETYNPLTGVTASDFEDGVLTSEIIYSVKDSSDVLVESPGDFSELPIGIYTINYSVTDSDLHVTTETITLTIIEETSVGDPTLLFSYYFNDGGSNNNSAYASTNLATNVSYAADNPGGTSGTTPWIANYANLSMTTATRLGGKLLSTEYGNPSANISTDFTFSNTITQIEIVNAGSFGTAGNVGNVYLQTSTDKTNWTTVDTYTTALSSTLRDITFDELNIASGAYIRIVVGINASGSNSGL